LSEANCFISLVVNNKFDRLRFVVGHKTNNWGTGLRLY